MPSKPLTKEQSDFAARYHNLIEQFLRMKGYPSDEFYDIAVFGYIRAVRTYSEHEDLRTKYKFQTIAYKCMRSIISSHFRSENCPKNKAVTCPYIEDTDVPYYADTVWESFINHNYGTVAAGRLSEILTPEQRMVAYMKGDGYHNREIAKKCNFTPADVRRTVKDAKETIRNRAPELLEMLAV